MMGALMLQTLGGFVFSFDVSIRRRPPLWTMAFPQFVFKEHNVARMADCGRRGRSACRPRPFAATKNGRKKVLIYISFPKSHPLTLITVRCVQEAFVCFSLGAFVEKIRFLEFQ